MTTDSVVLPAGQAAEAKSRRRAKAPKAPHTRRQTWKGFGLSLLLLVGFFAIAVAILVLGGVVLHHLVPSRHVNTFATLHNRVVLGVLLGFSVLWLMPPYPWATKQPQTESQEPAQSAEETEGGDATSVTDLEQYRAGPRLTGPPVHEGGAG